MGERLHPDGGCAPETCGGTRLDPCSYTKEEARLWTKSVYIVGGAGSGKSTFMAALMEQVVMVQGPLEDLYSLRNAKALVTLRGHRVITYGGKDGLYLGCIRESFPGTDGLDRASSPVGEEWLKKDGGREFSFLISEGATLATRRFLKALYEETDFLLVHLHADPEVTAARFAERGSNQDPTFVKNTVTRSANLRRDLVELLGARCVSIDTADPDAWELGLGLVLDHVGQTSFLEGVAGRQIVG